MNSKLSNFLIFISVLFSLSGAFNVGMTGFVLAIPFMALLGFLTYKKNRIAFIISLVFILACVIINASIYKNKFIFPVLENGVQIEVTHDNLFKKDYSGRGSLIRPDIKDVNLEKPTEEQKSAFNNFLNNDALRSVEFVEGTSALRKVTQIFKLKKGQRLDIVEIYYFSSSGFGSSYDDGNFIVTEFGSLSERELKNENFRLVPNVPIQSTWSKYLGVLMYWPLIILELLNPVFLLVIVFVPLVIWVWRELAHAPK